MTEPAPVPRFPTSLGTSDATTITVLGEDLAASLMGQVGFGELAMWLVTQRRPAPGQVRVFEAVLVALADHGFTPSAMAARLTYLGAPDSVQGALAAGLLGGGSRFLGVTEDACRFLAGALATAPEPWPDGDAGWDALALEAVSRAAAAGEFIPGLGTRCTRSPTRAPRPCCGSPRRKGCAARTCGCSRPSAGCIPRCSAAPCRSTARAPAVPRWPTWTCRPACCAASPCWPGRPDCSATWPKSSAWPVGMDIYRTVDRNTDYLPPDPV